MSNQDIRLLAGEDLCSFMGTSEVSGFRFGKLLIALTTLQKKAGPWFIIAGITLDAWHAELLGLLMDVQETQASKSQGHHTHYGPKGGHTALTGIPGESILFQIGVQMLADHSQYPALKCGKLVGLTFPPKGPVKDVVIRWDNILSSTALLEQHGTIVREDAATDSNGLTSLVFQPKDEPGATKPIRLSTNHIKQFKAVLGPSANVATSFGNVVALAANIIIPNTAEMAYSIEYHVSPGYKASGQVGNGTWSGVVCSLAQPFTVNALPPDLVMPFEFIPTSAQAGTVTMDVTQGGVHWKGCGTYTVQESGTENLSIVGNMATSFKAKGGSGNYNVAIDITLTPLDTNECGQP